MFRFIIGMILILIAVGVHFGLKKSTDPDAPMARTMGRMIFGFFGIAMMLWPVIKVVPANTVGIPVTFGKPGAPIDSGIHFLAPWTKIEQFSTRIQASQRLSNTEGDTQNIDCVPTKASDGSAECVDVTVRYVIDKEQAGDLYKRYGDFDRVNEVLIRRVTNDTLTLVFGAYTPEQAVSGESLEAIRADAKREMTEALDPFGITLDSISIGTVNFINPNVQARIDEKIAARQQTETAKIQQEKALVEAETARAVAETTAEQRIIAAQGEADAAVIAATAEAEANRIRSEALTPQVLQSQYYNSLAEAGTLIVTDGQTPVIIGG